MKPLCTLLFLCLWGLEASAQRASTQVQELTAFRLSEVGGTGDSYEVTLPNTIQRELERRGAVPAPFVDDGEERLQWVAERSWSYVTIFEVTPASLRGCHHLWLHLSEVETYAEVYLDGMKVGETCNEFVRYSFDLLPHLHSGTHHLEVRLLSTLAEAHKLYEEKGVNYPADNDRAPLHYSVYVRKPQYLFGWDWAPRIVTMGLGAPLQLEWQYGPTLQSVQWESSIDFDTLTSQPRSASLAVAYDLSVPGAQLPREASLSATLHIGERLVAQQREHLSHPAGSLHLTIDSPQLWMPRGYGAQPLYTLTIRYSDRHHYAEKSYRVGLREVLLDRTPDARGEAFHFLVNRRPIYAKGANYVPHDRVWGGGGRTLRDLFTQDLLPAHFNMLRLWGGGRYESEEFYALADSLGILLWQDLPFACSTYPTDMLLRQGFASELRQQAERLVRHPSLVLICGNNEVLEGYKHWGWKRSYHYSDALWQQMREEYTALFEEFIPRQLAAHHPAVPYIHGSPLSANWGRPESLRSGDNHYWGVWFGGEDFKVFDQRAGRFSSEFGFQAFPSLITIQEMTHASLDTLQITSPLLAQRQRSYIGNQRIVEYLKREYKEPTSLRELVYLGQVLQARGMGYALRAIRRAQPYNMGALYWQYNDVWPTVSWSSVDYYGNHKAMHYEVRRAFAPYLIDAVERDGQLQLCVVVEHPDSTPPLRATVTAETFDGIPLYQAAYDLPVSDTVVRWLGGLPAFDPARTYLHLQLWQGETLLASQLHYYAPAKELALPKPQISTSYEVEEGRCCVTLWSPTLAKEVWLTLPWHAARYSDNLIDLLPGRPVIIEVQHPNIHVGAPLPLTLYTLQPFLCSNPITD